MQLKQGMTTIARTLKQEMEKRFLCFLEPTHVKFKPLYVVATSLDLRYKVVLSDSQLRFAMEYCKSECSTESQVRQVL